VRTNCAYCMQPMTQHSETCVAKDEPCQTCGGRQGHFSTCTVAYDPVERPAHYMSGGIETIDFIEAKELDYRLGNVIKYVSRAGRKGDMVEDLKKARWYLDRAIDKLSPSGKT